MKDERAGKQHLGPAPFSPAAIRAGGKSMKTNKLKRGKKNK